MDGAPRPSNAGPAAPAPSAGDCAAQAGHRFRPRAAVPDTNKGLRATIDPLQVAIVGDELRTTSLVLGSIVMFVLLLACANVANLLLARGIGRTREIAVRAALGASSRQIARLLLSESLTIAIISGA